MKIKRYWSIACAFCIIFGLPLFGMVLALTLNVLLAMIVLVADAGFGVLAFKKIPDEVSSVQSK